MKKTLLFLLVHTSLVSFAQTFYDKQTVQTVEVYFSQANWDALLDNLAQTTEDYLLADSVRINGTVFDSVGVKYKGNSSYNANNNKNPLHINLNWVHSGADYQGYTEVKLQCFRMQFWKITWIAPKPISRMSISMERCGAYIPVPKASTINSIPTIIMITKGLFSSAIPLEEQVRSEVPPQT
ncbi:MAG: hypothetical protein EBU82_14195 [Flavobacteriia bacterium]|nr:hypothetical protein [Flavobacteriia bacterium]